MAGPGFFVVRSPAGALRYTRDGQFSRNAEGRLVDPRGSVLQADGGDLVIAQGRVEIMGDGVVLEAGAPVARLDVMDFADPALATPSQDGGFASPADNLEPVGTPAVRQGSVEMSNVTTAGEMVAMMAALRRAESGQKLANLYDDLMGRVISSFGQT